MALVENLKTPTLLDLQVDKGKDIIWFWWFNDKCNSKTARSVSGHWASKTMRLFWRKCECTQSPIKRNFTIWDVENPRHSKYEPICYQVFAGYLSLSFSFTKESPECSYQAVLVTRAPCQFLWRQSPISWPRSIKICDKAIAFRIRRDFSHCFVLKGGYCNGVILELFLLTCKPKTGIDFLLGCWTANEFKKKHIGGWVLQSSMGMDNQ